ncbi:centrosomal protein of 290 kDa-like [Asterias amurensis]|uniref:centrosomal protein of 290 kDa-like n=1 Tax=Asterias amurensis TaxID=7602 RepID=UPI003AB38D89
MAPLDWDHIMGLNAKGLSEEDAEEVYGILTEAAPAASESADHLLQLFDVTRSVMQLKNEQAKVAFEELENLAQNQGKEGVRNEQALLDQIRDLEEENKRLQRLGASSGSRDIRTLQNEIHELSRQSDLLQRELKEKDRELIKERRDGERFASRAEEAEREIRELKRDNDMLRTDLRDYQRQMESQRESMLQRRGDDVEFQDKLRDKNRELNDQLEEIQNLTEANEKLQEQCAEMTAKLGTAATDMDGMAGAHAKLKLVLQQTDTVTQNLDKENEILKEQIQDLTDQLRGKSGVDDDIMEALNKKVEEWKDLLSEKDEKIEEVISENRHLKEMLTAAQMDTDKTSVVALSKALEDKDKQLDSLKKQLEISADEMAELTNQLEDLKKDATQGGAPLVRLQNTIRDLRSTIKDQEKETKYAEDGMQQADADAREKDKQLTEALTRMSEYEAGEYGLVEAVQEIKECKKHITVRDRNIEELTQNVNKLEMALNDLLEENEELRGRLGLDPKEALDLGQIRLTKALQHQQDRALNQVLSQELERLEAERLDLKKQVRLLAQQRAQRAVALGLSADDMVAIEEFTEGLKVKKKSGGIGLGDTLTQFVKGEQQIAPSDSLRLKANQLERELVKADQTTERNRNRVAEIEARNRQLMDENAQLELSIKGILAALKEQNEQGGSTDLQIPNLERLVVLLETKTSGGNYDANVVMKAQLDQLTGRNEELRRELRQTRNESEKGGINLDRANNKITRLEQDLQALREAGQGAITLHHMQLPQGMAVSSAEVISSLNEQLIHALQELSNKETQLTHCESSLVVYRRRFAVLRHQQGLLYQEYKEKQEDWEGQAEGWDKAKHKFVDQIEQQEAKVQEFNRLLDTLQQSGDEPQRRMAEATRKITVLRVNERALTRRFTASQEVEGTLRKEVNKLRNEMVQMETAITERLGYLQRHKEASQFKIAALQRALDESVPSAELDSSNRQYNELAAKYRDLLQTDNKLVARNTHIDQLELENKRLEEDVDTMKRELSTEKEKLHTLELAVENLGKIGEGVSKRSTVGTSEHLSLAKRLTTMEMKELNERQRAEHAVRIQDQLRKTVVEMENRNMELEQKFAELTRLNLEAQRTEQELRDELTTCVTKAASDVDKRRIVELERSETTLRLESEKLKEMVDVASFQTKALESRQVSREKEVLSLRQQLIDIQTQSDEKAIIGKLHHHIVALQVSEGTAVRKLEAANAKIKKLEAQILRLQRHLDERAQSLYHCQVDARNKARHLKRTIQELRRQFSGAIPLADQEKFSKAMLQLKTDKEHMQSEVKVLKYEREKVSDQLAELEMKHQGLQELMETLQDGKGAAKVAEWHAKMQDTRLQHLKLSRQIGRLQEQTKFLDGLSAKHEKTITYLEQDNVRITRESEERQLLWEQREVELERMIDSLERQQKEMANAALRFEEATGSLPDPSLPISSQLEHAIRSIKNHIKTILDVRAENKTLQKKLSDTSILLKEAEDNLLQRDKIINELRLRLPASSERDEIIKDGMAQGVRFKALEETCEHKQALRVAQTQIEGLQTRLQKKEEALQKYVELLDEARQESAGEHKKHLEEINNLHLKLHGQSDAAFNKFKKAAQTLVNQPGAPVPTNKQLARLQELEDLLAEQDNSLSAMSIRLKGANTETSKWKEVLERKVRENKATTARLKGEHNAEVTRLEGEISGLKNVIQEKEEEIKSLQLELDSQKEANARAPTTTMKSLVERLRHDLALKEKQHKSLSQALLKLRADMVETAQQNVKSNADDQEQQINVQRLLEKETKHIREQLEESRSKFDSAKKELKRHRAQSSSLNKEIQEHKRDLDAKSSALQKLQEEHKKLQQKMDVQMRGQKHTDEPEKGPSSETDKLKRHIQALEEQLKQTKGSDVKGVTSDPKKEQSIVEVAKWEEGKKWEKRVESLKSKLKDKDKELEQLLKSNKMMKEALNRTERVKATTSTKLESTRKTSTSDPAIEELRKRNYELEEEVASMKRKQALGQSSLMEEVQTRNRQLTEKLDLMERQIAKRLAKSVEAGSEPSSGAASRPEKEEALQRQILALSQENLELRFDFENANRDVPRLKQRIEDLQSYNEALKADLEQERGHRAKSRLASTTGSTSNLRKSLGTSGKTVPELERTVGLMKKVVERVQKENEDLKKAPGVTLQTEIHGLREENQNLKTELNKIKHQVGGQLSTRYESTQKGVAKAVAENNRLRQDLRKEVESVEKLRVSHSQVSLDKERLQRQLEESHEKLQIEQARGPRLEGADSKSWKSIVVTRMYEEKLRNTEQEMEKKNSTIQDMKQLLRDSAHREQGLMQQVGELREKVAILERFPTDALTSDTELVRELQQTRLTLNRLENEKAELLNELKLFRLQGGQPGEGAAGKDDFLTERLHNYNKLMEENVDIRTDFKSLQLEQERLKRDNEKLRKELEQFDPAFFEEIEDLKFNYRESVQLNVQYEEQLRKFSQQFGVSVNIPPAR